jgi:tRNA(Ile)-lysidine synthase
LAHVIPFGRFHPAVLERLRREPPAAPWAVGFSGGPDSLALLLLLWAHFPERRRALHALHFDHRMRGRASAADAHFCREVAAALNVRFHLGRWKERPTSVSEAAAREARMAFFERVCRRRKFSLLWLGHQEDDVAETILMRLARGSGTAGLAAPRPIGTVWGRAGSGGRTWLKGGRLREASLPRTSLARPFLGLKKTEILEALAECRIPWRTDASNETAAFFRNRVRREVLARWVKASGRDALGGAALSRELLQEDDEALAAWTDRCHALTPSGRLRLARLAGCPTAIWRRALHRWLLAHKGQTGDLSRAGFDNLLVAIRKGRPTRQSLGRTAFAVVSGHWLIFRAK